MKQPKRVYKTETNSSAAEKARKVTLEAKGEINCSLCPWHKGENASHKKHGTQKPQKKDHR